MKLDDLIKKVLDKETGRPALSFYRKLLILLLLGIGLLWLGSFFSPGKKAAPALLDENRAGESAGQGEEAVILKLSEMIEQIKGVKNVKIYLTLDAGSRLELAREGERTSRQTREEDSNGGSREISEENNRDSYVILRDHQGKEQPLVVQEFTPRYRGVLIVAEGVENPVIRAQVVEALKTTLNLPYHRITVLPRGN